MTLLTVGNRYPQYATGADLFSLVVSPDAMLTLYVLMRRPSAKEQADFGTSSPLEVRAAAVNDLVACTFRFGGQPWSDSFYHPSLDDGRYRRTGNALHILLFDSASGELMVSRLVGLSERFAAGFRDLCDALAARPETAAQYAQNRQRTLRQYTTQQLRDRANLYCKVAAGEALTAEPVRAAQAVPDVVPEELRPHYAFEPDSGHCIRCVPECFAAEAASSADPRQYTVPLPVRYVLSRGYRMAAGLPVVDVPYDSFLGARVPEGFEDLD